MKPILQVEDDPNDVILLHHALKNAGVENPVLVANDGREAIDYLQGAGKFGDRKKFPLPGLVLLDLKLPFVMGLDVLKWIRQQMGKELVVIMLTASAEDADIMAAYRFGANAFLTKPSEASRFEDMLKALKDFWLVHNTLPGESFAEAKIRFVDSRTTIFGHLPSSNGFDRDEEFTKKAVNE